MMGSQPCASFLLKERADVRIADTCQRCEYTRSEHIDPLEVGERKPGQPDVLWEGTVERVQWTPSGDALAFGTFGPEVKGGDWFVAVIEEAYINPLVQRLADNWSGTGVPIWVNPKRLVYHGMEQPYMAVYTGETLAIEGMAPTLIAGQGVVITEYKTGNGNDTVNRGDVIYDPTDLQHAEGCQWEQGTVIRDVPASLLVVNGNWRHWYPVGHPLHAGWATHDAWCTLGNRGLVK